MPQQKPNATDAILIADFCALIMMQTTGIADYARLWEIMERSEARRHEP